MTLTVSSTLSFPPSTASDTSGLKQIFVDMMRSDGNSEFEWLGDNTVDVSNLSSATIHNFVLEAERLGHQVSINKKTTLQFS